MAQGFSIAFRRSAAEAGKKKFRSASSFQKTSGMERHGALLAPASPAPCRKFQGGVAREKFQDVIQDCIHNGLKSSNGIL
jgi:hypothetical protein